MSTSQYITCQKCNGSGRLYKCLRCGVVFRHIHKYSDCGSIGCDGERSKELECDECHGSGKANEKRS